MFDDMIERIQVDTVTILLKSEVKVTPKRQENKQDLEAGGGSSENRPTGTIVKAKKVGRNDPCPCGSGKKYKNCCGANN